MQLPNEHYPEKLDGDTICPQCLYKGNAADFLLLDPDNDRCPRCGAGATSDEEPLVYEV